MCVSVVHFFRCVLSLSMAIEFYRQALEILESTYGDDSLQVLKVSALVFGYLIIILVSLYQVLERLCQVYIEQNKLVCKGFIGQSTMHILMHILATSCIHCKLHVYFQMPQILR